MVVPRTTHAEDRPSRGMASMRTLAPSYGSYLQNPQFRPTMNWHAKEIERWEEINFYVEVYYNLRDMNASASEDMVFTRNTRLPLNGNPHAKKRPKPGAQPHAVATTPTKVEGSAPAATSRQLEAVRSAQASRPMQATSVSSRSTDAFARRPEWPATSSLSAKSAAAPWWAGAGAATSRSTREALNASKESSRRGR